MKGDGWKGRGVGDGYKEAFGNLGWDGEEVQGGVGVLNGGLFLQS